MTRIIIGIAVTGALALMLWLWFGASSDAPGVAVELPPHSASKQVDADPVLALQTESKARVELGEASARTPESSSLSAGAPAQDLRVRVVDPAGMPVPDVPLRVKLALDAKNPTKASDERLSRTTDAEGYALFPGVRSMLRSSKGAAAGEQGLLVHDIAFENPPVLKLDRSSLEQPLVVSVIPFSGIVDVRVRDLAGEVAPDRTRVTLALLREEDLASPVLPRDLKGWNAETHAGTATFPCVELGRTWEVLASRADSSVRSRTRGPGPVKTRGRAAIEIVLGADHPVVVFRAVDDHKNPLARVNLDIERSDHLFGWSESSHRETDEAGRFSLDAENAPDALNGLLVSYRADDQVVLRGRSKLSKPLVPGLNDGGDVVLAPEPILAEGIVQDSSGAAVPDAEILVATDQRMRLSNHGDSDDVRGRTDHQGHFELRGLVANGAFDLWARSGGLRSPKMRAHEGQRGIVLTLSAFYTLSGRYLAAPGVDLHGVRPAYVDLEHSSMRTEVQKSSPDGSFTLAPIPAGVYDIAWIYDGVRVAELDKLEVTKDTDLGVIDLRNTLHRFEIVLSGAPPDSKIRGEIAWRQSNAQERWKNSNFDGTTIALVAPASPVDVWVRPIGFRCDISFGIDGRREIPVVSALRVRLDLRTTGQLPKFPYLLYADLEQDGIRVGQRATAQTFTDDNRTLTYNVSAPGKVRVRWTLEWHPDSGSRSGGVLGGKEVEIEIADIPGEQVFPIELDSNALTQLTAKPPW